MNHSTPLNLESQFQGFINGPLLSKKFDDESKENFEINRSKIHFI